MNRRSNNIPPELGRGSAPVTGIARAGTGLGTAIQPYIATNLVPGKPLNVPRATTISNAPGGQAPGIAPATYAENPNTTLQVVPQAWMAGSQQGPRFSDVGEPAIPATPTTNLGPWGGNRGLGSVTREFPNTGLSPMGDGGSFIFNIAQAADEVPPWGSAWRSRDAWMRKFWLTEPFLAGAVTTLTMKYANFEYSLKGDPKVCDIIKANLAGSDHGKGWNMMMSKAVQDCFTQDNGGWMEIVRTADNPLAPFVSLNHLDAGRVWRTGRWEEPIMYQDIRGQWHRMKWYQVIELVDMPSPVEAARGLQYCAVTRILRMAQSIRDTLTFHSEKVSGRFQRAVHLVSGVQRQVITDVMEQHQNDATNMLLTRYIQPAIVASLDPNARVAVATIPLADLPEGFDWDTYFKWYLTSMASCFGGDYQDLAPLPTGNLGSSQGSGFILHLKSSGRGAQNFTHTMEHNMNYRGIMPQDVEFTYDEQDQMQQMAELELKKTRAQTRQIQIASGESSPELARIEAVEIGDLKQVWIDQVPKADLPTEMPGSFPGGPMKNGSGGTTSPETQSSPDNKSPGGKNPKRAAQMAKKSTDEDFGLNEDGEYDRTPFVPESLPELVLV